MDINYWAILVCGIVSMVLGFVWFGPLFGKKWMQIIGVTEADMESKDMQKKARPLYITSFILTLLQAYVLAWIIELVSIDNGSAVQTSLWVWAGFVIPLVAANSMWSNDTSKMAWSRFWINSIYYLILFIIFGLILGYWG